MCERLWSEKTCWRVQETPLLLRPMAERHSMAPKKQKRYYDPKPCPLFHLAEIFKQPGAKVSVWGIKKVKACVVSCLFFFFFTLTSLSEPAARPLLLPPPPLLPHTNEIGTAVSVSRLIVVTAARWQTLCRHRALS